MESDGLPRFVDASYTMAVLPCTTQSPQTKGTNLGLGSALTPSPPQMLQIGGSAAMMDQPTQTSYHHTHQQQSQQQQDSGTLPISPVERLGQHHHPSTPRLAAERSSPSSSVWEASSPCWSVDRNHQEDYALRHDPRPGLQPTFAPCPPYLHTRSSHNSHQIIPWSPPTNIHHDHLYRQSIRPQIFDLKHSQTGRYGCVEADMPPTWSVLSAPDSFHGGGGFPYWSDLQDYRQESMGMEGGQPLPQGMMAAEFVDSCTVGVATGSPEYDEGLLSPPPDGDTSNNPGIVACNLDGSHNDQGGEGEYEASGGVENGTPHDSEASTTTSNKDKADDSEPYARLIHRAFMSTPRHAMTLQEIYQWFRENTDKDNSPGKGWQNSIRHNLSMNAAFIKRDRQPEPCEGDNDGDDMEAEKGDDATSSTPSNGTDANNTTTGGTSKPASASANRKSTEWVLEEWAIRDGVQSTTRYRNSPRRGAVGRDAGTASSTSSSSVALAKTRRRGDSAGVVTTVGEAVEGKSRKGAGGGSAGSRASRKGSGSSAGRIKSTKQGHADWERKRLRHHTKFSGRRQIISQKGHEQERCGPGVYIPGLDLQHQQQHNHLGNPITTSLSLPPALGHHFYDPVPLSMPPLQIPQVSLPMAIREGQIPEQDLQYRPLAPPLTPSAVPHLLPALSSTGGGEGGSASTVKSEGEADEVFTPTPTPHAARFVQAFDEQGVVLLSEMRDIPMYFAHPGIRPGGEDADGNGGGAYGPGINGEMVPFHAECGSGMTGLMDVPHYGLAGVYDEALYGGCDWRVEGVYE